MRILSLSDIHYKIDFSTNQLVTDFFLSFKRKIDELNEESKIDVCVIAGDLAYSGDSGQYIGLIKKLRECISEDIPILAVPGNHDVNWNHLQSALSKKKLNDLFDIPEKEIISDLFAGSSKFAKVFNDFFHVFHGQINKGCNFQNNSIKYQFSEEMQGGFCFFEKEKVLLLLINSSWYSFGPGVIKSFFDSEFEDINDSDKIKESIRGYLDGQLSQIGKQSYFLDYIPFIDEILDIVSKNEDIRIISFAHHPISWLKWDERFNTSDDNKWNVGELLNLTHLHITGHIHNPVQAPSIMNNKSYHLNNGAFLDYTFIENSKNKIPQSKFPNSYFTIIDIENAAFNYSSFLFDAKTKDKLKKKYSYNWTVFNTDSNKYYKFDLLIDQLGDLEESLSVINNLHSKYKKTAPVNLTHFQLIMKKERNNVFIQTSGDKFDINKNINYFNFSHDQYLILINRLNPYHNIVCNSKTSDDLMKNDDFRELYEEIEKLYNSKSLVVAFYDFVSNGDNVKEHEALQRERDMVFQSFKHIIFTRFPKLFPYKDLKIVYDMLIIESN